jgi:hypothetical protein
MASKTVRIFTSDLSGREIQNTDELAEIRVLDHPGISRPVKLDAYVLEVQSLLDAHGEFITLELELPGQDPRRVVVPADAFSKLFANDVTETLAKAEPLGGASTTSRHERQTRPTRAARSQSPSSMSREQRGAVRDWANNNGFQVGDRGRIKSEVLAAFEAAHAS